MRFGVLGSLAVWTADGASVPVPEVKVRALLAGLLIDPGRVVSSDRLVEDLWGDAPPARPARGLQTLVSRLRAAFAEAGGRELVVFRPPGYLLRTGEDAVDAGRFATLSERARGTSDPRERAALFAESLAQWRGPAFADFADEPFARAAVARLEELRLLVWEEYAETRLLLGEYGPLTGDLAELTARHPLRERLRAAYMRALYGAGRPTEALEAYEDLRRHLAEELGLEPGTELVALQRGVLRQEPGLLRMTEQVPSLVGPSGHALPLAKGAPLRPAPSAEGGAAAPPRPAPPTEGADASIPASRPAGPSPAEPLATPETPGSGQALTPSTATLIRSTTLSSSVPAPAVPGQFVAPATPPPLPPATWVALSPAGEADAHTTPLPSSHPRTNLPLPVTGLIGRSRSVAGIREALTEHRLVTLVGSGGVGKTRLALEVAGALTEDLTDGVWLVELGGLTRSTGAAADGPAEMVAAVLGIRDDARPRPHATVERLAETLRDRRMLLVLDNCEHVVESVACLVRALLLAVPGLRVLATSREPLSLSGERLWSVPPLDVPRPDASLPEVARSGAVRLFVARAAAASPGFTLTRENAGPVATMCRRLDGIPLALELASSRLRALGAAELAERLDDRFGLLTAGPRDAPARQRTLRAVIDWSWELLTAAERTVLSRLAVAADGCSLSTAEVLCSGGGVRPSEVIDLLARLVDRSLVVVTHGADGPRYRLLESLAAYCLERLREPIPGRMTEYERLRRAHARHYTALTERANARLRGAEQRVWLTRLDAEAANVRCALDTAVLTGDAALARRLVRAMSWYWFLRGRLREAARSLATALELSGVRVKSAVPPFPGTDWSARGAAAESPPWPRQTSFRPSPETGAPETGAPETGAPETGAPETGVPKTGVPKAGLPESGRPEGGPSESGRSSPGLADASPSPEETGPATPGSSVDGPRPGDLPPDPSESSPSPSPEALLAWHAGMTLLAGDTRVADAWGISPPARREVPQEVYGDMSVRQQRSRRSGPRPLHPSISLHESIADPRERAGAGWLLGHTVTVFGPMAVAEELISRTVEDCRASGDHWGVAAALSVRGVQRLVRGELAASRRDGERSLTLFAESGDRWGRMRALVVLGALAEIEGDYAIAESHRREGLRIAEELELWTEVSIHWSELGRIALLTGDHARADELHERGRRLAVEYGDRRAQESAEIGLALTARRQGRLEEAERHLRTWLEWNRRFPAENGTALILAELGFVAEQRGDAETALKLQEEGLAAARDTGDPRAVALALEGLAGAHRLAGDPVRAAGLLGTASRTRLSLGTPLPPGERGDIDRIGSALRSALGEEGFATAFATDRDPLER
ncbi:BTAD domain-containing putative transcriptional regulator [Streptomyces sp. NPDC057638]|uniref:BTAD domain-containing putative transcriptional regulator n=1 Tax=Streptomyces sp. NPDC057638 TaxID=3346190 RepID=UPI0036B7E59D